MGAPANGEAARSPLGRQLYEARVAAGVGTVAEASRRTGINECNYSRLEHRAERTAWETVRRVIVGLELPLERFFPAGLILAAADRLRGASGTPRGG